jgi:RNA polymerase sigma-70 factor (ECF subfamily)
MTNVEKIAQIEQIYKDEFDSFIRRAYAILHRDNDSKDAVQDGFCNAINYVHTFKRGNIRAWCYRCVINSAISIYRKNQRRENCINNEPEKPITIEHSVQDILGNIMDGFSERRRLIVTLRIEGVKYKDIAGLLGIKLGTVFSNLDRARKKIRYELKNQGITLHNENEFF